MTTAPSRPNGEAIDAANAENFVDFFTFLAAAPGAARKICDGFVRVSAPVPHPFYNFVYGFDAIARGGDLDTAIREALAPFRARHCPMMWIVFPALAAGSERLTARLAAASLASFGEYRGMAVDLSSAAEAAQPAIDPGGRARRRRRDDATMARGSGRLRRPDARADQGGSPPLCGAARLRSSRPAADLSGAPRRRAGRRRDPACGGGSGGRLSGCDLAGGAASRRRSRADVASARRGQGARLSFGRPARDANGGKPLPLDRLRRSAAGQDLRRLAVAAVIAA